eukprot:4849074-Pyramimonas_sp.AAC.1
MPSALDAVTAHLVTGAASQGERRRGRPAASPGSLEDRVRHFERAAVSHERDLHELQDRVSYAIFFKDEAVKIEITQLRQAWRTKDRERKDKRKLALQSDKNATMDDH